MGCIHQEMSSLELAVVRLKLSGTLFITHAFAFPVLVCFVSQVIIFLATVKELIQSVRAVLFYKIV